MPKTIDTLAEDIYKALEEGAEFPPYLQAYFSEMCVEAMKSALTPRKRKSYLRCSNIGKKDRALWYDLNEYEGEKLTGSTLFKFLYGHLIEAMTLTLAKAAGHEVKDEQRKIEVDGIRGSIDAIIDGKLVDVKSCSSYAYREKFAPVANLGDDDFGYAAQGAMYSEGTGEPFYGWLAIDKQNGNIRASSAEGTYLPDAKRLVANKKAVVAATEPPEKCYDDVPMGKSGNRCLAMPCGYCAFKEECWKDANDGEGLRTFLYSNKPVFMTVTKVVPKVVEVASL